MFRVVLLSCLCVLCLCGAGFAAGGDFMPENGDGEHWAEFRVSSLRCVIGDNAPAGDLHRAGYNGIFQMAAPGFEGPVFVPSYAGLNLEHYFDGRPWNEAREIFFEPRVAPMSFRRVDDATAELHQPQTPYWGVESWSRFTLREPDRVDFVFRCTPHKPLEGGFLGCFWASYMAMPEDKSLYFIRAGATLDAPKWAQFCTLAHNRDSTILPESDDGAEIEFPESGTNLYNSISPLRHGPPLFYGRIRDHVLICLFEPGKHIRFSHSPSGGGGTPGGVDTNPAWDFQFIVPGAVPGGKYGFQARVIFKPWKGRGDVIDEARLFFDGLK